jgi:hypothetical protein
MTLVSFNSNRTDVTAGAGTANLLEHLGSLPVFSGVRVSESLIFRVVFCRSLSVPFKLRPFGLFARCDSSNNMIAGFTFTQYFHLSGFIFSFFIFVIC